MRALQIRDALQAADGLQPGRCLRPEMPLAEGLRHLQESAQESLPVVDANENLLGVLTRDGALQALLEREEMLRARTRTVEESIANLVGLLGSRTSEEGFLQVALERFRSLLGCRYAAVVQIREDGSLERFVHAGLSAEEAARIRRHPEGRGLLGLAVAPDEVLRLDELEHHPAAVGFPPGHPRMQSLMLVALPGRDRPLGRIYFSEREDGRSFGKWEEGLARSLAAWLGSMLEHHRLLRQEAELRHMLSQSQKMEALGRLAGCVAHDFNNLLTAIGGFAEILLDSLPPEDPDRECAREILRAAERAGRVTRQLLAVSRRQILEPRDLEIHEILEEIAPMLRVLLGERIRLELALIPEEIWLHVDPSMLEQVLLNLVANARDVLPKGGSVVIRTRVLSREEVAAQPEAGTTTLPPARRFLALEVVDDGPGMDAATLDRIFEPFFTTRVGEGTGLGLATVFGSVQQAGGLVRARSEPGQGATFTVLLPVLERSARADSSREEPLPRGRGELVLVVEDEPHLGVMALRLLESLGYTARLATSVAEARQAVEQEGPPQILLADLVLPDGTGEEVALWLRSRHPEVPVLFSSGYADADPPVSLGRQGVAFLPKPWTRMELGRRLAALLEEKPAPRECRVLVVDDQPQVRDLLARFLVEAGHEVRVADNGQAAEELVQDWAPEVLVCDVVMPGLTGVEVASRLRQRAPGLKTVMISGAANASFHLAAARRLGAVACLEKPVTRHAILDAVARAAGRPLAGTSGEN